MKTNLLLKLFLILFSTPLCWQSTAQVAGHRLVETTIFDLNHDGKPDTIRFYKTVYEQGIENHGEYDRVEIQLNGQSLFTLTDTHQDVFSKIDQIETQKPNAIDSDLMFVYPEQDRNLVLFFGWPYGTGREFYVLEINRTSIELLYQNQMDMPEALFNLDQDGKVELIGRNIFEFTHIEEDLDAAIGDYRPFLVYRLENPAVIDLDLTQAYNEEHYVWAGLKYDESLEIAYPRDNSKPYIYRK